MARIGAAHGIKGEVRVKSFTAEPLELAAYGPLEAADGRRFAIEAARPAGAPRRICWWCASRASTTATRPRR